MTHFVNARNYRAGSRKLFLKIDTFLFDDTYVRYEIILSKHYPDTEMYTAVSSVCLPYV